MFNVGDEVCVDLPNNKIVIGKIDEIDGDTVYLTTNRGVEMDFPVKMLRSYTYNKAPEKCVEVDTAEDLAIFNSIPNHDVAAAMLIYDRMPFRMANFMDSPMRIRLNFMAALGLIPDEKIGEMVIERMKASL